MKKGAAALLSLIVGGAVGAIGVSNIMNKQIQKKQRMSDKHLALFLLMNQWLKSKQGGKNIEEYLIRNGYKKIAIYGMSYIGERLYEELKESDIMIAYAIDEKADQIYTSINVVSPDSVLSDVDAIIVTAVFFFDEIKEKLSSNIHTDILSLEDILFDL